MGNGRVMDKTPTTIKVTLALSLGVGLGVVLGFFIASRRRRRFPLSAFAAGQTADESNVSFVDDEYKMVLVVRNDLKMGKGKMAAQCAHAAVGGYKHMMTRDIRLLSMWEDHGQMKVVVKAPDEASLLKASSDASRLGLNTYIVRDAGRTQIAPGTKTVVCVGPGPATQVDIVTGDFKLY